MPDRTPETPPEPSNDDESVEATRMPFDDPETDKAVDNIVATESDELLAAQDAAASDAPAQPVHSRTYRFWHSKITWYSIVFLLLAGITTAGIVQPARYWVLNTATVRVSSSVRVTDELTHQPLKNVEVRIGTATARTGGDGRAVLTKLRLGPTQLTVKRTGFASYERAITVGWGSNPLDPVGLKAVGIQYTLRVQDSLTSKGIEGAEVTSGDATALSDKNGVAILAIPGTNTQDVTVDIARDGYRTTTATVKALTTQAVPISMVTSRKAVFVSKQSGKYDLYSIDADGQNKKVILPGSGLENGNISLVVSPDGTRAALVSTRDNQKTADGLLLNTLTVVTIATGDSVTIAHAEQIKLIDWLGSRLVFEQINAEGAAPSAKYGVYAYDYASTTRLQLATASRLKSVLSAQNGIYYAPAADEADATAKVGLYKVNPDGNGTQTVLNKGVWNVYRTDYNTLSVQTSDGWYAITIATGGSSQISAPSTYIGRVYIDNPANGASSLWTDVRGGQGVLLRFDRQTGKDAELMQQAGLVAPVRWLTDDTAIFRAVVGGESADYAVSALGTGQSHKITDVVNTYGFTAGQ